MKVAGLNLRRLERLHENVALDISAIFDTEELSDCVIKCGDILVVDVLYVLLYFIYIYILLYYDYVCIIPRCISLNQFFT